MRKATAPKRSAENGLRMKRKRGEVMAANRVIQVGDRVGIREGLALAESNLSMPNMCRSDSITDRISVFLSLSNRVVVVFPKVGTACMTWGLGKWNWRGICHSECTMRIGRIAFTRAIARLGGKRTMFLQEGSREVGAANPIRGRRIPHHLDSM